MGKVSASEIQKDSLIAQDTSQPKDLDLAPSKTDSVLREQVAEKDKYNLLPEAVSNTDFTLFAPIRGTVSRNFKAEKKHYGIDINAKEGSPIKAVRDGTVIFSEWTVETGYVIILEHQYNLISVYKHNKNLLKKQGDLVKSGEVIARLGNTGELSDGAHLHFELWSDGYPVNPEDYINFN
jgi:murein DD-endopeptidase MepM/ murein hydrolase activator NlpD